MKLVGYRYKQTSKNLRKKVPVCQTCNLFPKVELNKFLVRHKIVVIMTSA